MTKTKNKDYITSTADTTGEWKFWIRSSATRVTDTVTGLQTAVEKLWNALQPFCRVTKCGFHVRVYEQTEYLWDALTLAVEEERGFHETVESATGVDSKTLGNRFKIVSSQDGYVLISYLKIEEIDLCLRLGSSDRYVTKSDTELYKRQVHDEIIDEEPHHPPLEIRVAYHPDRSEEVNAFDIWFTSTSDIWFADTKAGEVNRQRLVSVFDEIQEQFNVAWTQFSSEKTSKQGYKKRGMTDIIFE